MLQVQTIQNQRHRGCNKMSCNGYTPECESNICEMADDCMEFDEGSKCVGAGACKCDNYVSREDCEEMMRPNETHDEFIDHEDL